MHLLCMALFFVRTAVYGISRYSEHDFKAANFAEVITDRRLTGSILKEVEVNSESSCQFECVEEKRCQSYNFGTLKSNSERYKCQLSQSDRFASDVNFTVDVNFNYRGIQSTCESSCGVNEVCIADYQDSIAKCNCRDGYTGKPCSARNCAQLFQDGFTSTGVYSINPDGGKSVNVLCDMVTDGGGWTVFQKRLDGSVDFYLGWGSYKNGFGDLHGEFWLGNDNLHRLTAADDTKLRIDLEDFEGNIRFAKYETFRVAGAEDKYRLRIEQYSGTAGNSLANHNNQQFTTKDSDNDDYYRNCAQNFKGAWWYKDCHRSNLNGLYLNGTHSSFANGVNWKDFRGQYYSLRRTEMKLK